MKYTIWNNMGEFGRITQSEISLQQNWQVLQVSTYVSYLNQPRGFPRGSVGEKPTC